jgi:hypothetical protein
MSIRYPTEYSESAEKFCDLKFIGFSSIAKSGKKAEAPKKEEKKAEKKEEKKVEKKVEKKEEKPPVDDEEEEDPALQEPKTNDPFANLPKRLVKGFTVRMVEPWSKCND